MTANAAAILEEMNREAGRLSRSPLSEAKAAANGPPAASDSTSTASSSAVEITDGVAVALEAVRVDGVEGSGEQAVITFVPSSGAGGSESQVGENACCLLSVHPLTVLAYCFEVPCMGNQYRAAAAATAAAAAAAAAVSTHLAAHPPCYFFAPHTHNIREAYSAMKLREQEHQQPSMSRDGTPNGLHTIDLVYLRWSTHENARHVAVAGKREDNSLIYYVDPGSEIRLGGR